MDARENAYLRHQQRRFMRPDAARYLRPDMQRFVRPGCGLPAIHPALARKYIGQPRIPEGAEGAGQFTFGTMAGSDEAGPGPAQVIIDTPSEIVGGPEEGGGGGGADGTPAGPPRVIIWKPSDPREGDGDGDGASSFLLTGDLGTPNEGPPEVPENRPRRSSQRTAVLRSIASFLGRNSGFVADVFLGVLENIEWLQTYQDMIDAARDPPKSLGELQKNVGKGRPGYDDHHIIEQTAAEKWGLPRSTIDDRSNLVSIPRLKHYQITGWFMRSNPSFGGLSPREYLRDKSPEEARRVGLSVLILYEVLKP
jgi:hypothetical protein